MSPAPPAHGPEGLLLSFARDTSTGDGLSELFGEVAAPDNTTSSGLDVAAPRTRREARLAAAGVPVAPAAPAATAPTAAPVTAPATAHLSRREARAAQAAIAAPETSEPQVPRPEVFSYDFEAVLTAAAAAPVAASASTLPVAATSRSSRKAGKTRAATARALSNSKPVASKPPVKNAAAQKPSAKKSAKKKVSSFATILAVAGFFASACIPAFAFADSDAELAAPTNPNAKIAASLTVSSDVVLDATSRDSFSATTQTDLASQRDNVLKIANYEAYMKSGALEKGDDYPWFSELSNNQGGGLSPLNYYYRECVDFVAWRLNVDAGSTKAPFKWDWHSLTPNGGNAYQWKSAWENHGWKTSTTPVKGSVAWFGYHVGYVTSVNDDGTVTIEEYNHSSDHLYGKRTIPATDVISYLYPPG